MEAQAQKTIEIALTADEVKNHQSADLSIVIDVLRASSVIVTALANKTPHIVAAAGIEEALQHKKELPDALLAGERNAIKIEGFDRGNSPLEYLEADEPYRPIILTTTNGTRTINNIGGEGEVQIASFLNISTVANYINDFRGNILLACSGTNGNFSLDDFMCAGGLLSRLNIENYTTDDMGHLARQFYQSAQGDLHSKLSKCMHYNYLEANGFGADLDFCIREDIFPVLAEIRRLNNGKLFISQKK